MTHKNNNSNGLLTIEDLKSLFNPIFLQSDFSKIGKGPLTSFSSRCGGIPKTFLEERMGMNSQKSELEKAGREELKKELMEIRRRQKEFQDKQKSKTPYCLKQSNSIFDSDLVKGILGIGIGELKSFPSRTANHEEILPIKICSDCKGTGKIELFTSIVDCECKK